MNLVHDSPYVMNSFLSQFPELVVSRGGDLGAICSAAGLSVESVIGKHQLIPFDKFIFLLETAANELQCPQIALKLAGRQDVSLLGPMYSLLSGCTLFVESLSQILRYLEVIVSGVSISAVESEYLLEMQFDVNLPQLYPRKQFQNYLLASSVSMMRSLLGGKYPIRGCFFSQHESDSFMLRQHAAFFGCPVAFDSAQLRITMDRAILSAPAIDIAPQLRERLARPSYLYEDIESRVRKMLGLAIASGDVSLTDVAAMMGCSSRTLQRRLAQESLSFAALVDSMRFSQANQYLSSTHYRISDISALLGYKNQSAFTRSYMRWSGLTPTEYRETLYS